MKSLWGHAELGIQTLLAQQLSDFASVPEVGTRAGLMGA